jgi:hypothetical protein
LKEAKAQSQLMSYEDIEEARKKCAAKDATKGKGKRGWKRKSATIEADEPEADEEEPEPEVARTAKEVTKRKRGRKRKSAALEAEPEVAQTIEAPEPWRAPVAHMYWSQGEE